MGNSHASIELLVDKLRDLNISNIQFAELLIIWNSIKSSDAKQWIDKNIIK